MSQKKYLSLERLAEYDALLKAKIAQDDAATLDAAKEYADQKFDGHTHSWNELADKPFGEESGGAVIEWDGSTDGRESFDSDGMLHYKVSDLTPSKSELVGAIVGKYDGDVYSEVEMTEEALSLADFANCVNCLLFDGGFIIYDTDCSIAGNPLTVPSTGTYLAIVGNTRISKLTYGSSIRTLDEKYIPDTIARKSDLDASITNITNGDVIVKEAEHATSADSAITADSATSAESATKATQDGNGSVIADTYETKADAAAKLDEAKEYTDTLKTYVGTIPEGATATDVVGYIQEKTAGIASEGAMTELSNRVGIVEGKVATIEGDYLTSADKTELQTNIDTVSSAVELLTNGVDAETVDGVNDLIAYVNEHGAEVTGMKADIKANADALAELAPVAKTGSWNDLVDRPFGEEGSFEEILSETELSFVNYYGSYMADTVVDPAKIVEGQTYTMVWDGTAYTAASFIVSGEQESVCIGNPKFGGGDDNGIPFYGSSGWADGKPTDEFYVVTDSTETTHTLSISAGSATIHTLDEKYIPASIARVSDIPVVDLTPYETKEDASAKLTEAKTYVDEKFDGHVHSWNELEDKPFGEEGIDEELLAETTTTFRDAGGPVMGIAIIDHTKIEVGKRYTLIVDGVAYESEAFPVTGGTEIGIEVTIPYIGNPNFMEMGYGEDNGLPFIAGFSSDGTGITDTFYVFMQGADGDSHIISLSMLSTTYHPLDEAFIPDTIARVEDQDALASRVTTAESDIDALEGKVGTMETDLDAVEAKASANETAIGNLNTAVAGKVAQGDFNSAVDRVAALEAWHEGFEEITAEDINGLFA